MKTKLLASTILSLVLFGSLTAPSIFAQPRPTNPVPSLTPTLQTGATTTPAPSSGNPVSTPVLHINIANCDRCGYCEGATVPSRWEKCRSCLYEGLGDVVATENKTLIGVPTPDPLHYYTDFGCISTKPGEFATQLSNFFFWTVGGIAFLFFLYGAGIIATSQADPQKLNHGKRIVYGAIIGLLFVLFSVFILRFIAGSLGVNL